MPIERAAPELDRIVATDQAVEKLAEGYLDSEGPLWWKEEGYLLFSDIPNNRRMKWSPSERVSVFREPTNNANGLTRDLQGRLVACESGARRVTRLEHDGSITVIANGFKGHQLNSPNDVVVKSDGSIYFTDPWFGRRPREQWDLDFSGVYRVSPDLGTLTLLVQDFNLPNGLAFSVDESLLYVDDSSTGCIRALDVMPSGALDLASDRIFCDMRGERPGNPDGMKLDVEGNVYCTGSGGVWIIDSSGKHLGTIVHGQRDNTNVGWGDDDWKTLFITTGNALFRVRMNIPGLPVPVGTPG
jgi:gluconolactonase